jgi:mannitol-specific phosphotransferase system IIBC component
VLAYTADTWTQIVVALSIFVPVVVTIVLAVVFLRGKRNDPDEQRLRRAQEQYEAARRDRES